MLKVQEIREIVEMIENSSIQRFEFSQADTKLVIVKQEGAGACVDTAPAVSDQAVRTVAAEKTEQPSVASQSAAGNCRLHEVTSPMVGTFYAAPDPESPAFVKVGQKVAAEQVVCIIEVMKLFNEVQAGVAGEIVEVLVKDGDFVEYGQPLFVVKVG